MKTFSSQLALVTQVSEKSKQLILSAERKQKSMTASFERGRAPILTVEDNDNWVIERS